MSLTRKLLVTAGLAAVLASGGYGLVAAASKQAGTDDTATDVTALLKERLDVTVLDVQPAPIEGLHEVLTDQGVFYLNKDGTKLLQGRIYSIDGTPDDLTERSFAKVRLKMLESIEGTEIVFPAKEERHVVTVFTDIDCGYCRKLHKEMQDYNDVGITVRYLAYPRAGLKSSSGELISAVWCADNPNAAMTQAKSGKQVKAADCDSPVETHYNLGQTLGVRGTPAIIREDGRMLPGYLPATALLHRLQNQ